MTVVFAYDYGPGAGLGHKMRCAVIAGALRDLGVESVERPVDVVRARAIEASVIVVDSYRTRADDRDVYRATTVIAVDDLARDLDVSLVIDPAPGAKNACHRMARHALVGAQYALVDPALLSLRVDDPKIEPRTLLVATGASDTEGVGAGMATRIAQSFTSLNVKLAVGPWGDGHVASSVELIERSNGLGADIALSDIVVTAGGVALLEALCLGRPTIAVPIAENQLLNVAGVVAAGAALSSEPINVCEAVARLVADAALRAQISDAATTLIDGNGAGRVARAIVRAASEVAQ